jgi:prolyl oligopeptidase
MPSLVIRSGILFLSLLLGVSIGLEAQLPYPTTKQVDHVDTYHGTVIPDPYRWLENADAADTKAWIEAQNRLTFSYLSDIPGREYLKQRLTALWNYERYTTPSKEGEWYIFSRNDGLQNQSVLYRQRSLETEAELLMDPNTLSEDGTIALSGMAFTKDGSLIAYGLQRSGSDWRDYKVRDVQTGQDLADHVRWIKFAGVSWTNDGRGFFYSRYPEPAAGDSLQGTVYDQKVYYHRIGTSQNEDVLVYVRPDQPEWGFDLTVTDDGRYGIMAVWHGTDERNRVYYIDLGDADRPDVRGEVIRLLDDFDATYDFLGNDGPRFYFRTNLDAPRYRVIAIDVRQGERDRWETVIAEHEDVLAGVDIINDRFVAEYLHNAHSRVAIFSIAGEHERDLDLPTLGSVGSISGERDDTEMFYSFTSFLYPSTIFRYDFTSGEPTVFRAPEVDFDPTQYETRQIFYRSKDGMAIPMFLTHRKGIELDGTNPTYLYGYGGFNISLSPGFSVANLVWLELGGVYALANLRGGGEYGKEWHRMGMLENKQNVFDDFIAAGEYLIEQGYTSREKLSIGGGSNGGLLVGAVLNQRPDLFAAALPAVGVMDMLRFQKFTIGWAWVSDYGSSEDPEMFSHLYAYSPYHNLRTADYPAIMVTTADHDDRVVPGHSFKYAARLQAVQQGDAPVLIRVQTSAGHGSGKPTTMRIEEAADRWAFVATNLKMHIPSSALVP